MTKECDANSHVASRATNEITALCAKEIVVTFINERVNELQPSEENAKIVKRSKLQRPRQSRV